MNIKKRKEMILKWSDFYGGDILDENMVKEAKSKKDLLDVLDRHGFHLENMAIDAQSHLDDFKRKLGLW